MLVLDVVYHDNLRFYFHMYCMRLCDCFGGTLNLQRSAEISPRPLLAHAWSRRSAALVCVCWGRGREGRWGGRSKVMDAMWKWLARAC